MRSHKVFMGVVIALSALTFVLARPAHIVYAADEDEQTLIDGTVKDSNGKLVKNAQVVVICHRKNKNNKIQTSTDNKGHYKAAFVETHCKDGDRVDVAAKKGPFIGTGTGIVLEGPHDEDGVTINIILSGAIVPEFGMVTGSIAVGLSALYLLAKRRHAAV